jgi:hypothetical protein
VHFMIIARDESKRLVRRDFMGPPSWVCEVDQAGSVPNSGPMLQASVFRKGLLSANPQTLPARCRSTALLGGSKIKSARGAGDTKRSQEASRRRDQVTARAEATLERELVL